MSAANAAAKKRRAPPEPVSTRTPPQSSPQQSAAAVGLTLPQVIAVIDRRLTSLEGFMNETKSSPIRNMSSNVQSFSDDDRAEYNERFTILAEEIGNLKNIVLSLQSYTMSVTKTFMEDKNMINHEQDEQEEQEPSGPREQPSEVTYVLSEPEV